MYKHFIHINRKKLALFFLVLFAFANTPKRVLHNVVTSHIHKHLQEQKCSHTHIELSATGLNCQVDNLVVEMPFVLVFEPTFIFFKNYTSLFLQSLFCSPVILTQKRIQLRGPPVC